MKIKFLVKANPVKGMADEQPFLSRDAKKNSFVGFV
jgi:hypothetical protein